MIIKIAITEMLPYTQYNVIADFIPSDIFDLMLLMFVVAL